MSLLSKASFVSIGLLLIGSAAQAQSSCQGLEDARVRIRTEYEIARAKFESISYTQRSELCSAGRYKDALHDKLNDAYKRVATCLCRDGLCEGLMDEWAQGLKAAEVNKKYTDHICTYKVN